MITVQILEGSDMVQPDDWCRPLSIVSINGGHSDYYSFRGAYSGTPENNVEWVRVNDIFGKGWFGKPVAELQEAFDMQYEFVRGSPPISHCLNFAEGDYRSLADPIDANLKTFDEWKESGYYVKKGEKARGKLRSGKPLFHRTQVKSL